MAKRFYRRHGHLRVPSRHREAGFGLSSWLSGCRTAHKRAVLAPQRAKMLERLPGFHWDPKQARHEEALLAMARFAKREGHSRVPPKHKERGFALGTWVVEQRERHRAGRVQRWIARRLERLPGWTWTPKEDAWKEVLGHLRSFVRREGHARVPYHHREGRDRYPLGLRVWSLRTGRRLGELSTAKTRVLEVMRGWVWNAKDWTFEQGVRRIREYAKRAPVAATQFRYRDPRTGYGVGRLVFRMRDAYWKGRLTRAQIQALEGIKGWSWGRPR